MIIAFPSIWLPPSASDLKVYGLFTAIYVKQEQAAFSLFLNINGHECP